MSVEYVDAIRRSDVDRGGTLDCERDYDAIIRILEGREIGSNG